MKLFIELYILLLCGLFLVTALIHYIEILPFLRRRGISGYNLWAGRWWKTIQEILTYGALCREEGRTTFYFTTYVICILLETVGLIAFIVFALWANAGGLG